jgi:hypothetical protein
VNPGGLSIRLEDGCPRISGVNVEDCQFILLIEFVLAFRGAEILSVGVGRTIFYRIVLVTADRTESHYPSAPEAFSKILNRT